jgi:hypothetical protein
MRGIFKKLLTDLLVLMTKTIELLGNQHGSSEKLAYITHAMPKKDSFDHGADTQVEDSHGSPMRDILETKDTEISLPASAVSKFMRLFRSVWDWVRRPVLSQVAQVMLAKYGSQISVHSGAVRLVRVSSLKIWKADCDVE